jgi:hypothetical protein
MSYAIEVEINGFEFQFGDMGYHTSGVGVYINFEDEKIREAIKNDDPLLLSAIKELFVEGEEIDALFTMDSFENYELRGRDWNSFLDHNSFNTLENFKRKALIVLESDQANDKQIRIAQTIIDVLNGDYVIPPPPEKSPEEKQKMEFNKRKPKLKLKLVIANGYKCDQCSTTVENSLCVMRKNESLLNYDIDNLVLRCRRCINKMKKKTI